MDLENSHPDKFYLSSKSSMKPFDVQARTDYGALLPAKDRILDFKRRQLVRQDSGMLSQQDHKRFGSVFTN